MTATPASAPEPDPYSIGSGTWPGLGQILTQRDTIGDVIVAIMITGGKTGAIKDPDAAMLRARLTNELGDLRATIDYVITANGLDWTAVNSRRDRKRAQYDAWHREARAALPGSGEKRLCQRRSCASSWR